MSKKNIIGIAIVSIVVMIFIWWYFSPKEELIEPKKEVAEELLTEEKIIEEINAADMQFFGETDIIPEINPFRKIKINPFD